MGRVASQTTSVPSVGRTRRMSVHGSLPPPQPPPPLQCQKHPSLTMALKPQGHLENTLGFSDLNCTKGTSF